MSAAYAGLRGPRRIVRAALIITALCAAPAAASERYALIITGAAGGDEFAQKYNAIRDSLASTFTKTFSYPPDHVIVLAEDEAGTVRKSTKENVEHALADLRRRVGRDDVLTVILVGHGTAMDGEDAKFNLPGPDLTASEWAELVKPIAGRVVFVDTTSASFPFLHRLAGKNRIVLTATDSIAQQYETAFPEFFAKAFGDPAADLDKNGRVSVWEAFSYASAAVRQSFDQKGTLPTERPLLDDTGDGIGRESQTPGPDGALARTTYFEAEAAASMAAAADAALDALVKRRDELTGAVDALRARKSAIPPDQYADELERILVELARVSRDIRIRSVS